MGSVYSHIDSNKKQTFFIMFLFTLFFSFFSYLIGVVFYNNSGFSFLIVGLVISFFSGWFSYYFSSNVVLFVSGASVVTQQQNPYIHSLVENLCIASGLPKPAIYIIDDSAPNAFATGRNPKNAAVCFTTGILQKLNKTELEGVIAHELAHIQNYDILLMSIVSVLVGTISLVADFVTRGSLYSKRDSDSKVNPYLFALALILLLLSPIIATLIKLAVSRNREFLADSSAALLTRYPKGLADALKKISTDAEPLEAANSATAHLFISNPFKNSFGGSFMKLFDTHPPVEERIKRLLSM